MAVSMQDINNHLPSIMAEMLRKKQEDRATGRYENRRAIQSEPKPDTPPETPRMTPAAIIALGRALADLDACDSFGWSLTSGPERYHCCILDGSREGVRASGETAEDAVRGALEKVRSEQDHGQ